MPERFKVEIERVIYGKRDTVYGGWHYRKELLGTFETEALGMEEAEAQAKRRYPLATWVRLSIIGQFGNWEWLSSASV